jgi:hypothetical protein
MRSFFELTFRPFFVIAGAGTALASLFAFWPEWAVTKIARLAFVREHTIIVQHWGILVSLTGALMIVAAFRAEWRQPILAFAAVEKAFIVYLVVRNGNQQYADGFLVAAFADAAVVLYTVAFVAVCGSRTPMQRTSQLTEASR